MNVPQTFARGDVVQLKSGGPLMTVEDVFPDRDLYTCVWVSDSQPERQSGGFYGECLKQGPHSHFTNRIPNIPQAHVTPRIPNPPRMTVAVARPSP